MKTRRKLRLWSAMLALLLTVLYTVPAFSAVIPEETVDPQTNSPGYMQPLSSYQTEHSYDEGIVDGAVYCLINAYNGQSMDVSGAVDANNTPLITHPLHRGLSQQFRIHYIGQGLYEIVPAYTQRRLHMDADHDLVIYDKNWGAEQKFRIQMLDNVTGMIFPQHGNFSRALAWDETNPNMVVSKSLSMLSNQAHAHWIFERVGTTADMYAKFYLRYNGQHQQRIDVIEGYTAEGSLVHACPVPYGNVNQEWKTYYDEAYGCYYLHPGNSFDMALDYRGTNLAIYHGTKADTQKFWFIQSNELDASTGRPLYAIQTMQNTYVTMGIGMNGGVDEPYSYIGTTTTPTFCWFLEGVPHDATKPDTLTSINTWLSSNVEPGFMQEQYFCFTPTVTSRYKIELRDGNVDFADITLGMGAGAVVLGVKTYNGIRVADVFCQAGVTYYITIYSKNPVDGSTTTFSIRTRQLTAVGHSYDDPNQAIAANNVEGLRLYLELGMNFIYQTRINITVDQIEAELDAETGIFAGNTGYTDFNAEIFVYVGHGLAGNACYDGTNIFNSFDASDLPDMSNCELAIWGCCRSALPEWGDSLYSKSLEQGARVVIAWNTDISKGPSGDFIKELLNQIYLGHSVLNASRYAICNEWHFRDARMIVENLVISENSNYVIFPNPTTISPPSCDHADHDIWTQNLSEYTLVAENESIGAKIYTRMINGIPTDDFYVEFYDDGKLTSVHKSEYAMTEADVESAMAQLEQLNQTNVATASTQTSTTEQPQYQFQYVDGEWILVGERTSSCDEYCDCGEVVFYNALTGEEIAQ